MDLYSLLYHLKNCPEDFLLESDSEREQRLLTEVLLKDTLRMVYGSFIVPDSLLPPLGEIQQFALRQLMPIKIGCWLFSHPLFRSQKQLINKIHVFLFYDLMKVCPFVKYRDWIEDDERAEEFLRLAFKRLDLLPDGETEAVASDKLDAIDTVKRQQILKESSESFERIMAIRKQMIEQKAREAANVYGRE